MRRYHALVDASCFAQGSNLYPVKNGFADLPEDFALELAGMGQIDPTPVELKAEMPKAEPKPEQKASDGSDNAGKRKARGQSQG